MSKKGTIRTKPDIPKQLKTTLTTSMRADLVEETFENSTNSTLSSCSDPLVSTTEIVHVNSEQLNQPHIRLETSRNQTICYESEPISIYDVTCGTISFESMVAGQLEAEEVAVEEDDMQQLKRIQLQEMILKMDEPVNEQQLKKGTQLGEKLLPGVVEELLWNEGEAEMAFIQDLIVHVNTLVAISGRTDIILQHSIGFDKNRLPTLRISLGQMAKIDEDYQQRELEKLKKEESKLDRPDKPQFLQMNNILQLANAGLSLAKNIFFSNF